MHFAHHNRQERREQQRDVRNDFIWINQVTTLSFWGRGLINATVTQWLLFVGFSRQGSLALFVQLMPILILIIVSALSQLMVTQPPYSLSYRPWVLCPLCLIFHKCVSAIFTFPFILFHFPLHQVSRTCSQKAYIPFERAFLRGGAFQRRIFRK